MIKTYTEKRLYEILGKLEKIMVKEYGRNWLVKSVDGLLGNCRTIRQNIQELHEKYEHEEERKNYDELWGIINNENNEEEDE